MSLVFMFIPFCGLSGLVGYFWGRYIGHDKGFSHAQASRISALTKRVELAKQCVTNLTIHDFEEHAKLTVASKHYGSPGWFHHCAFKLFGESGEFAEHVGKASRDDGWDIFQGPRALTPARRLLLLKELGDMLWYIVMLAKELGSSLMEVMLINIQKREGRMDRGTILGSGDNR